MREDENPYWEAYKERFASYDAITGMIEAQKVAQHAVNMAVVHGLLLRGPNVNYEAELRREILYLFRKLKKLNAMHRFKPLVSEERP